MEISLTNNYILYTFQNAISHPNIFIFLQNLGYICEEHNNPADFFLDTIIFNQNNMRAIEKNPGKFSAEDERKINYIFILNLVYTQYTYLVNSFKTTIQT